MTLNELHQYRTKLVKEYGQTKDVNLIKELNRVGLAIDELHTIHPEDKCNENLKKISYESTN